MTNTYLYKLQDFFIELRSTCTEVLPGVESLVKDEYKNELKKFETIVHLAPKTIVEHEKDISFLSDFLREHYPGGFVDDRVKERFENLLIDAEIIKRSTEDIPLEFCQEQRFCNDQLAHILEQNENLSVENKRNIEDYLKLRTMFV